MNTPLFRRLRPAKLTALALALAGALAMLATQAATYEYRVKSAGLAPAPTVAPAAVLGFKNSGGATLSTFAFPDTAAGSVSATQMLTVSNTGNAALTFGAPAFSVAEPMTLGTTTCSGTLAAGGSCTVNLSFSPSTAQAYNTVLTVNASLVSGNTLPLTGKGLPSSLGGNVVSIWSGYGVALMGLNNSQIALTGGCGATTTYSMALDGSQLTSGPSSIANHAGYTSGELIGGKLVYRTGGPNGQCYNQGGWASTTAIPVTLGATPGTASATFNSSQSTSTLFSDLSAGKLFGIDGSAMVEFSSTGSIVATYSGAPGNGWVVPLWRAGKVYSFVPSSPTSLQGFNVNTSTRVLSSAGSAGLGALTPAEGRAAFDKYGDLVFVDSNAPTQLRRVAMANYPTVPAPVFVPLKNPDNSTFSGATFLALRANSTGLYAFVRLSSGPYSVIRID